MLATRDRARRLLARLVVFPVPTAAAINGHAFGMGALLALAHDHRVMRDDRGWFCFPEVDLGLRLDPFLLGLVQARLVPAAAQEAILTGRRYTGPDAASAGIVNAVAPLAGLEDAVMKLIAPGIGKARKSLGDLKRDMNRTLLAILDPG
jgi:enoyl-CoA hydratase/carnithine racemase